MFEEEHKRKDAVEILKLAGVLDDVDADVAELCIEIVPDGKDKLMSLADLMKGVQKIKDKLKASVSVPLKAQEHVKIRVTDVGKCDFPSCEKERVVKADLVRNGERKAGLTVSELSDAMPVLPPSPSQEPKEEDEQRVWIGHAREKQKW